MQYAINNMQLKITTFKNKDCCCGFSLQKHSKKSRNRSTYFAQIEHIHETKRNYIKNDIQQTS